MYDDYIDFPPFFLFKMQPFQMVKTNRTSNNIMVLSPAMNVDELINTWPRTIQVFFQHRMACVGCWMASFDTLEDVANNYSLDVSEFILALESAPD